MTAGFLHRQDLVGVGVEVLLLAKLVGEEAQELAIAQEEHELADLRLEDDHQRDDTYAKDLPDKA